VRNGIAPRRGTAQVSARRAFHIGHCSQISVDGITMICWSFQQDHGDSAADSQYGRGMNSVGTDQ
jgi:hypothetical protein